MSKRFNQTSAFSTIKLAENGAVPKALQVLKVGKFKHELYGDFEITKKVLADMVANFDNRSYGIDIAFDYFHKSDDKAAGWPGKLELRDNGTTLWADEIDWTPTARKMLADKEVRYFSPDFAFAWQHKESGESFENILFGGGLTNRPFVKGMEPITADENGSEGYDADYDIDITNDNEGTNDMTELEKAQARIRTLESKNFKLSEEVEGLKSEGGGDAASKMASLKEQIAKLQGELEKLQADNKVLSDEKVKAEEAKTLAEKESKFAVLLSEKKACAAQKDAYLKGDMETFLKLAETPNSGKGSSEGNKEDANDDEDTKILKLAETKVKADKNLNMADAISLARKETKAAAKK